MDSFIVKFIFWGILTALAYHIVGGIRHMLMDFGFLGKHWKRVCDLRKFLLVSLSCFQFWLEPSYGKQRFRTGSQWHP